MKEKIKNVLAFFKDIAPLIPLIVGVLIVIAYLVADVIVHIKYGEMTISELPAWTYMFFFPIGGRQ